MDPVLNFLSFFTEKVSYSRADISDDTRLLHFSTCALEGQTSFVSVAITVLIIQQRRQILRSLC